MESSDDFDPTECLATEEEIAKLSEADSNTGSAHAMRALKRPAGTNSTPKKKLKADAGERILKKERELFIPFYITKDKIREPVDLTDYAEKQLKIPRKIPLEFYELQRHEVMVFNEEYNQHPVRHPGYPYKADLVFEKEKLQQEEGLDYIQASTYWSDIIDIGSMIATGQRLEKLIADFMVNGGIGIPVMFLRYHPFERALLGAVSSIEPPIEMVNQLLEFHMGNDRSEEEKDRINETDIIFGYLNYIEGVCCFPPGVLLFLSRCKSLCAVQAYLNWFLGFKVIKATAHTYVQVNMWRDAFGILVSRSSGSVLYTTREDFDMHHFINPITFFGRSEFMCYLITPEQFKYDFDQKIDFLIFVYNLTRKIENYDRAAVPVFKDIAYPPWDEDDDQVSTKTMEILRLMGFEKPAPLPRVPLPLKNYSYLHMFRTSDEHPSLRAMLIESLYAGMNTPLSLPIFRWDNVTQHFACIIPNGIPATTMQQIVNELAVDHLFGQTLVHGVFGFQWRSKTKMPQSIVSTVTTKLIREKTDAKTDGEVALRLIAPETLQIIVILTQKMIPEDREMISRSLFRKLEYKFSVMNGIMDIVNIDDGGAIQNIFTQDAALRINKDKTYQCSYYINPKSREKFAMFLSRLNESQESLTTQQRISLCVAEKLKQCTDPRSVMCVLEAELGSEYKDDIIRSLKIQTLFAEEAYAHKGPIPDSIIHPDNVENLGTGQLKIYNFVHQVIKTTGERSATRLDSKRNLLICGKTMTYKTSFGIFLDKYFRVYWKGQGQRGTHEFWRKLDPNLEIIIVDEWEPQESDFTWINNVGEGSDHSIDVKFSSGVIPAGCHILLMTNHEPEFIRQQVMGQGRGRESSKGRESLWEAFDRRFEIVHLTGEVFSYQTPRKQVTRHDRVPDALSIKHLPTKKIDIKKQRVDAAGVCENRSYMSTLYLIRKAPTVATVAALLELGVNSANNSRARDTLRLNLEILRTQEEVDKDTLMRMLDVCEEESKFVS